MIIKAGADGDITIKIVDNNKIEVFPAFADKQQLWVQETPQSNNIISTNRGKSQEKFSLKTNYLREIAMTNKNEDETPFKTGTSQKTTPSDASSSIYSLLNKLQNVNEDFLKNSEKLTNVIDSDGSQLVFENDIKKGSNTETKGVDRNPHLSSTDITSNNSLSQISENVNNKFSEKIGKAEYENVIKSLEKDNAALREDINDLKELVKMINEYYSFNDVFTIDIYGLIYRFRLLKRA